MKGNAVSVVILLLIGMQTFADDNSSDLENINIEWQLFDKTEHMKLNILGVNQLFFYNKDHGSLAAENVFQNNAIQREQSVSKNSQKNYWFGSLLLLAGYSLIWADAYENPVKYRYFEDKWERQRKIEEETYGNIIRNND